jgi:thiol-disulfide isomerase/thioredoxin
MVARIGEKAPNLKVSKWVQGFPTNIDQEKDKVILVEVFQVNCPGCFMYGIPMAIDIYKKYKDKDVRVIGLATAFEDFDKNTLENLELLINKGKVIGETYRALMQYGMLNPDGTLPYKIPFPVAMDMLVKSNGNITDKMVMDFINERIPDFDSYPQSRKAMLIQRVREYLASKEYTALTFEEYALQGTPSSIVIDRDGILRHVSFGYDESLELIIKRLI